MAQAAWRRPALNLSSWSCIGPRRRFVDVHSNSTEEGSPSKRSASSINEISEPLILSSNKGMHGSAVQNIDLPVSSSEGEWSSEMNHDAEVDNDNDTMSLAGPEDWMNEVELWQQLEHELYDSTEGEEADVVKEIREEEEAAIGEATINQTPNSAPKVKEVHRFFPPGRIMHIVTLDSNLAECEDQASPTSTSSENSQPNETSLGIFLTSRCLYSKLRLSQTMISDHFMPVYRRQIEKLIKELETEEDHRHNG